MIIKSQFKAPWWLQNRHVQTIWQSYLRPISKLSLKRERFELSDGDFLDIDMTRDQGGPIALVLHGLEGSLDAKYSGILKALENNGFTGVLMYHRSCSGEINRNATSYHSGYTNDAEYILSTLKARFPTRKIFMIGYSLGGSITLHCLAKLPEKLQPDFACVISPPFLLKESADTLNKGFAKVYRRFLLKRMINKVKLKKDLPGIKKLNLNKLMSCNDFLTFDHEYTAKIGGYKSGLDYYEKCSPRQLLNSINTELTILHAKDDPFMNSSSIPSNKELSDKVSIELSEQGGHVGFIYTSKLFHIKYWSEERIISLLEKHS